MRIVRFLDEQGQIRFGDQPLAGPADSAQLLNGHPFTGLKPTGETVAIRKLLAPIEPSNIFCIGCNYAEHAKESGVPLPENPIIFMKPTTAATNPGDPVRIPKICGDEVDFETELAVVIGKQGRDIAEADALSYVLGYTGGNDISARVWQKQGGGGQWVRGKSFDTFCPLGPALVTADDMPDPQTINLSMTLNGNVMQQGCTDDMIFTVAKLISFISSDTTLLPGTVIMTGTPVGVGFARDPKVLLQPGDEVIVELDQIGKLRNPVEAGN